MPKVLPPISLREDIQASARLSAKPLLGAVRKTSSKIPGNRAGSPEYSPVDALMSGAAVFGLKFPYLLKFDENLQEAHIRHNLQTLYGVTGQTPCDTQMRKILDPVEPAQAAKGFNTIHRMLERNGVLQKLRHMNGKHSGRLPTLHKKPPTRLLKVTENVAAIRNCLPLSLLRSMWERGPIVAGIFRLTKIQGERTCHPSSVFAC